MPTQKGDSLDYYSIDKDVFKILFEKSFDQFSEEFLISKFNKNRGQIKAHILRELVERKGSSYKAIDESAVLQLKHIQKILHIPPQIHSLTENSLFEETMLCTSNLSQSLGFKFDEASFTANKNNFIMCVLELLQNCEIKLHDGGKGMGYITVGSNNTLHESIPKIENLNLCLMA